MKKRWTLLTTDEVKAEALHCSLQIHIVLCRILVQRGIDTPEKAIEFFNPNLSMLHNPFLMKDMDKAVERIQTAIAKKEKILIFGDYDVDGTTAVAVVYQYLNKIYDPSLIEFYIPHRYQEGYGISKKGIEYAASQHIQLIISLDCGIKSVDLIAEAKSHGIDFIVCDHHLPEETLPPAYAILNAKQPGCPYPYKELCGCGVGFKLIAALSETLNLEPDTYLQYLDLVATAIAADIVPMTGENRVLASLGLKKINSNPSVGIKSLIELSGIKKELNITDVVFVIAPRVNAAGRMDDARKAVQMFIETDPIKAKSFAQMLHTDNSERKTADLGITKEALEIIRNDPDFENRKSTVVYQEHWQKGVVGIVASRLIEHYYRPTVVLTRSGDMVSGSARSVEGFNLYEAIYSCKETLVAFGGHFAAAGLSMLPENVSLFRDRFDQVVKDSITPESLTPEIRIDAEIRFKDITPELYSKLQQLEPCGPDNLNPVFIARSVRDAGCRIVKEEHIRFQLEQDGILFTGIGFRMAGLFDIFNSSEQIDVLFTISENEWNGYRSLQLKVIDFQPALTPHNN